MIEERNETDDWDQDLDARAAAFKVEIERRLAEGPATVLDFAEVKRAIRREVAERRGSHRHSTLFDTWRGV